MSEQGITWLLENVSEVDELPAERDRAIEDLKRRVEKLEAKHNGSQG